MTASEAATKTAGLPAVYGYESDAIARYRAREWYWLVNDKESYVCPDCGRGIYRAKQFDVHHIDGNPHNNDPPNLLGLCHRCHMWRHHEGSTIRGLDTEEWKDAFLSIGDEDGDNPEDGGEAKHQPIVGLTDSSPTEGDAVLGGGQ